MAEKSILLVKREELECFLDTRVCVCLCFSVCRLMEWLKQERLRSCGLERTAVLISRRNS